MTPPTATLIARCGACGGRMTLYHEEINRYRYVCRDCHHNTEPRSTADLAAEDVVWVEMAVPRQRLVHREHGA